MFIVQRRKNSDSEWHTVKSPRGKYQGKDIETARYYLAKARKEFPGKEHRILDGKTGEVVEVR
jgi:hypothetical protein